MFDILAWVLFILQVRQDFNDLKKRRKKIANCGLMRNLIFTSYFSCGLVPIFSKKYSQDPANYFQSIHLDWGGSSLGKVLAASTWGPENRSLAPMKEPGVAVCICSPITGGETGGSWKLACYPV